MATDTPKALFLSANTWKEIRDIYSDIDWISRPKKGMSEKSIFVAMFTTFIIALYDDDSPLCQCMILTMRKGLGDDWTKKHSLWRCSSLPSATLLIDYFCRCERCHLYYSHLTWNNVGRRTGCL
jgi:hypothetical protein